MEMPDWLAKALKQGKSVHCHVKNRLEDDWVEDDIWGFNAFHDCPYKSADMYSWRYAEPYTPLECVLKPFQPILGRDADTQVWKPDFFSEFNKSFDFPYVCLIEGYKQCIPYEGNEKYKGTSNNFVND